MELADVSSFQHRRLCLCHVVIEDFFRPCSPDDLQRCYGDQYAPIRFFAEIALGLNMTGVHTLQWAEAGQFAVSRDAVRRRPRATYALMLGLLNGTASPVSLTARSGKVWTPFEWAHLAERLWLLALDTPPMHPRVRRARGNRLAPIPHRGVAT
jgi:hypothetical protein